MKLEEEFIKHLLQLAQKKRENAGFAGSMGDGGASRIEIEIEVYEAGVAGEVPNTWKKEYKEFSNKLDPQYEEYLELKKRFEK